VRHLAATCAFRAEDFARAVTAYRRFLDLHPRHAQAPRAWLELGRSLAALSRDEEAADAFGRAPPGPSSAALQAESLFKAGRTADAMRLYESLAQTAPDPDARARATLALAYGYAAQEKWAEAERLYLSVETLLDSAALRPVALDRLASLYARAGQTNLASRARAELRRRYPDF